LKARLSIWAKRNQKAKKETYAIVKVAFHASGNECLTIRQPSGTCQTVIMAVVESLF